MIALARDRDYRELADSLNGRRVVVMACLTCARFCGVSGRGIVEGLSERLVSDGASIVGTAFSKACCLMSEASDAVGSSDADVVLAVCCDMGARNAAEVSEAVVVNPFITLGPGYVDLDGNVRVVVGGRDIPLDQAASERGCGSGPY